MEQAGDALEEVLSKALSQRSLTLGVYEAAKLLNVDPDNVVLCLLAAEEEEAGDAALQIHFTLLRAFCCENDINILRVSNPARLAELLLPAAGPDPPADLHCVLVTVSPGCPRGGTPAAPRCRSGPPRTAAPGARTRDIGGAAAGVPRCLRGLRCARPRWLLCPGSLLCSRLFLLPCLYFTLLSSSLYFFPLPSLFFPPSLFIFPPFPLYFSPFPLYFSPLPSLFFPPSLLIFSPLPS
uniref:Growth arrest and DNA damage-inducible protein GADD45 alpha n=1 Tax=Taeniopygia guttata TaxID=59729 RepID=A0A674GU04_TAEGU